MPQHHFATGQIIAVQEQRFRLLTSSGQTLLLTLNRFASLPASLGDLLRAQAQVQVEYEGQPNLAGGVARRIQRIEG